VRLFLRLVAEPAEAEGRRLFATVQAFARAVVTPPQAWVLATVGTLSGVPLVGIPTGGLEGQKGKQRRGAEAPPPEKRLLGVDPRRLEPLRYALWAVLVGLMASCAWFSLPAPFCDRMPGWLHEDIQELELWQVWDMFSPNPMDTDIWLRGVGQLSDGTTVDVLHGIDGGPLPPPDHGFIFTRWTKFINNLAYTEQPTLLEFGKYLCRTWNGAPPPGRSPLKSFKIYREQRRIPGPHETPVPWGEAMIWDHHCF
ncbi:MAG: hypothetical protein ACYCWW_03325, partial [Deltaproteobacteria bacterium]